MLTWSGRTTAAVGGIVAGVSTTMDALCVIVNTMSKLGRRNSDELDRASRFPNTLEGCWVYRRSRCQRRHRLKPALQAHAL